MTGLIKLILSPKGEISRFDYWLALVLQHIIFLVIILLSPLSAVVSDTLPVILFIVFVLAYFISLLFVQMKRWRSIGFTPWLSVVSFIFFFPVAYIIGFIPSLEQREARYKKQEAPVSDIQLDDDWGRALSKDEYHDK